MKLKVAYSESLLSASLKLYSMLQDKQDAKYNNNSLYRLGIEQQRKPRPTAFIFLSNSHSFG
jgi:hypothetical protein